jgi:hypothetical protein
MIASYTFVVTGKYYFNGETSYMPGSRYVRRNRLSRGEQQLLKQIGLKIHRELYRRGGTTESLSLEVNVARSTIREVIAGRSNVRILTLKAIVQGLGFSSVKQFLADIEPESENYPVSGRANERASRSL